jgi:hypothetical protein
VLLHLKQQDFTLLGAKLKDIRMLLIEMLNLLLRQELLIVEVLTKQVMIDLVVQAVYQAI